MKDVLNYTIFEFGKYNLKLDAVLILAIFMILVFWIIYFEKKTINHALKIDAARKYAIYTLVKYITLVISSVIALQILGFNISVLMAGSAAFLVGLGLGIQNLFSDYISGIVLLTSSTIKVGDIIEMNGMVCKVTDINLRTTTVLTSDDKSLIIPNTNLTRNQLINWTHNEICSRFDVTVGVDYSSDINLVTQILNDIANQQEGVLKDPKPFVRLTDFGDSAINVAVYFWSNNVFGIDNIKSDIRFKIFETFNKNNIILPFPQRVLHQAIDSK
ncbi:MAG: mechanosensitive ion channel [Alphaproteobacteria bacterium]|nr:mechanosensitive ion channel [Alphaproteobacteria bacterium]